MVEININLRKKERYMGLIMIQREIWTWDKLMQEMRRVSMDSSAFEKMAVYVEKNYQQIIFMTAEEAAKQAKISQGSVSKFCQALGFRGYNDFQRNLQKIVSETITATQRLVFTTNSSYQSDDLLVMEAQNIMGLTEIINTKEYSDMVESIVNAKEVILLGARLSAALLPYLKYMLDKLRDHVHMVTPETNEWNMLSLKESKDTAIIVVGFPRYPNVIVEKMKELKKKGFRLQAITDSQMSPILIEAERTICIPLVVSSIYDMYSTPMAFFNLLVRDVAKRMPLLEERLDKIEAYDSQHGNYYKI